MEYAEKAHVDELAQGLAWWRLSFGRVMTQKHVTSYRLSRPERRRALKAGASLDLLTVHHVSLNGKAREAMTTKRGDTVVPTPKRLHEVRAHWRRLQSGNVVRVRSHRRGQRRNIVFAANLCGTPFIIATNILMCSASNHAFSRRMFCEF